jgi:C4-dicarboxylate transporter, DctM subunit
MELSVGLPLVAMLIFAIACGLPVALSLVLSSFVGIAAMRSPEVAGRFLASSANDAINEYTFGVIPLFILMGLLVSQSGVGKDTFDVFESLMRRILGGLGIATVASNTVFAAITGVSIASVAVFSKIAVPEMRRHGYSAQLSVGIVAGSSVLGMLIPPSLLLIVFGIISEQSIGKLFLAGLLPGALLAVIFSITIMLIGYIWPRQIGKLPKGAQKSNDTLGVEDTGAIKPKMGLREASTKMAPMIVLIILVLGGLYGGLFSPTEAGAVGAAGALVIALLRRSLDLRSFWQVTKETGNINVSILFLIIGATLYTRALSLSGLPAWVTETIVALNLGYAGFLIIYVLILVIMGFFIDAVSILLIVVPIMLPVTMSLGMDPIWFGIITIVAVEIGLLTPPFGLSAFAVKASLNDPDLSLSTIFIGAFPFVLGMFLLLAMLAVFPEIALVLT